MAPVEPGERDAARGELDGVARALYQVPRVRFVRRPARSGAGRRTGDGAIGLRPRPARAGDEVRDLPRSAALDPHADPGGQVQTRGTARGIGGPALRRLVEPVRHRHELAGRGELPDVPQAVAGESRLCDVPRVSPVVAGEAAGGVAMSARLVGWMPHIGRLTAAVGASARLGATRRQRRRRPRGWRVAQPCAAGRAARRLLHRGQGQQQRYVGERRARQTCAPAAPRRDHAGPIRRIGVRRARDRSGGEGRARARPSRAAMAAQLQWLDGPFAGQTINLPHGEIVIGRAETCGLVVDSDAVSRMHARHDGQR